MFHLEQLEKFRCFKDPPISTSSGQDCTGSQKFLQIAKMYGVLRRGDENKLVVGLCKASLGGLREQEGKLKKQDWVAYANKFAMEEERSLVLEHWLGE